METLFETVPKQRCFLQGTFLGGVEGMAWLIMVAGLITQAQQLMKNVKL